jgi:hypothetical protein
LGRLEKRLEIASAADQRRHGVGAQLRWARTKCRHRCLGERSTELKRIFDQGFKVDAGCLAGERFSNTTAIVTRRSGGWQACRTRY